MFIWNLCLYQIPCLSKSGCVDLFPASGSFIFFPCLLSWLAHLHFKPWKTQSGLLNPASSYTPGQNLSLFSCNYFLIFLFIFLPVLYQIYILSFSLFLSFTFYLVPRSPFLPDMVSHHAMFTPNKAQLPSPLSVYLIKLLPSPCPSENSSLISWTNQAASHYVQRIS